jgi:hypothetical protein
MEDKPCCAAAAARKIRKLVIGGREIGIAQLDEIVAKVGSMGLEGEATGIALLKEVKIFNYVPRDQEEIYKLAMLDEYCRRESNGN